MRPTLILSTMLTLATAVMAGGGLPKQTCHSCTVRVRDCTKVPQSPLWSLDEIMMLNTCVELP